MLALHALVTLLSLSSFSSSSALQLATYTQLAASIVPVQFSFCLTQLTLGPTIQPDSVKPLRSNLLHTRDLLDIFSFAYPPALGSRSSEGEGAPRSDGMFFHDPWRINRVEM